jgi:hypothetical protein
MQRGIHLWAPGIALILALQASATSVPGLTFEQLTDRSELIVSGQVTRSWSDWDSAHKFIWTHYELSVSSVQKGAPGSTLVVSEPGGVVGVQGMNVAGAVTYQIGDQVLLFLQRMPNGYLRTTGWSQGKFTIDGAGRLHPETSSHGLEIVAASKGALPATPLSSLDGITVSALGARVATRMQLQGGKQ